MAVKITGDTDGDLALVTDWADPIEGLTENALAELEYALAQRRSVMTAASAA